MCENVGYDNRFTKEELLLLSDGMISLIQNVTEAKRLISDGEARETLTKLSAKYQTLNAKICRLAEQ